MTLRRAMLRMTAMLKQTLLAATFSALALGAAFEPRHLTSIDPPRPDWDGGGQVTLSRS